VYVEALKSVETPVGKHLVSALLLQYDAAFELFFHFLIVPLQQGVGAEAPHGLCRHRRLSSRRRRPCRWPQPWYH
jgi:hypothetical protein